jgi:hypothetical protein
VDEKASAQALADAHGDLRVASDKLDVMLRHVTERQARDEVG